MDNNNFKYLYISWEISIPFCTVYTVTSRLSWAMFPFTIVAICGVGLAKRVIELLTIWETSKKKQLARKRSSIRRLSRGSRASGGSQGSRSSRKNKSKSVEIVEDEEGEEETADGFEGFTKIQKGALGFVWAASCIYACITDKILSKVQTDIVICTMREDPSETYNLLSVLFVIGFPILCLVFWPVGHLLLDLLSCMKGVVILSTRKDVSLMDDPEEIGCCGDDSDSCIETILIFGFTTIFLVVYPTSMLITEFYFGEIETMFPFMMLKYCLGSMPLVLSPACVLVIKRDIRKAAKDIYMKRATSSDEGPEITLKELVDRLEQLRATGNVRKILMSSILTFSFIYYILYIFIYIFIHFTTLG